ncbi:MAG: hypothetical protein MI919_11050, partial [Holophagales bacterium]|nr:hypothetical protein [Holophagales bacterium]
MLPPSSSGLPLAALLPASTLGASLAVALAVLPSAAMAAEPGWPDRGYRARACGFDMDRDGIFGEPEDCH